MQSGISVTVSVDFSPENWYVFPILFEACPGMPPAAEESGLRTGSGLHFLRCGQDRNMTTDNREGQK